MTASFSLQRADIIALSHALTRQHKGSYLWSLRIIGPLFIILAGIVNLAIGVLLKSPPSYVAALLMAILLLNPLLSHELVWRRTRRARNFDLQTSIELREDAVFVRDGAGEAQTPWERIVSVQDDDKYLVLVVAPRTGEVIPKRAFTSSANADDFVRFAHTHWERAHPPSQTPQSPPIASP